MKIAVKRDLAAIAISARPKQSFSQYGLTLIVLWIGAMKFTAYEAEGIRPLAENSPWMSWLVAALDIRAFSEVSRFVKEL
jgi:reactive chlorine resistance protein C